MAQKKAWEREYKNPKLVTGDDKPQSDVRKFFKFLKKNLKIKLEDKNILDLGCGTGRNSNYLAKKGNKVVGLEISNTALIIAKAKAREMGVKVDYKIHNIGSEYISSDNTFDLVLDVTASNSLDNKERKIYLEEVHRVLKPGGIFYVRTLCKDGDKNAKKLIKKFPGKEQDTYINKEMNLVERVFTEEDFRKLYSKYFEIIQLTKKSSYTKFGGQSYKRNFWLAVMKNK
jgi:SAM-dependent methyltransferase